MSEKLNASYAKNASKLGKYFLIKSLTPRQGERIEICTGVCHIFA